MACGLCEVKAAPLLVSIVMIFYSIISRSSSTVLEQPTTQEFVKWPGMRERALACAYKRVDINCGYRDYDESDPL